MNSFRQRLALGLSILILAGCSRRGAEDVGTAPIAQLDGPWLMINRTLDCQPYYAQFGAAGIFRLSDNGPSKKLISIQKFTLAPGTVTLLATGIDPDPERALSMVLSIAEASLRVVDLLGPAGESYKNPPANADSDVRTNMKSLFRITEQRFALDRCPVV